MKQRFRLSQEQRHSIYTHYFLFLVEIVELASIYLLDIVVW